jgi:hypothetical protein
VSHVFIVKQSLVMMSVVMTSAAILNVVAPVFEGSLLFLSFSSKISILKFVF